MAVVTLNIDSPIMNGVRPNVMKFGFMFINILLKLFFFDIYFLFLKSLILKHKMLCTLLNMIRKLKNSVIVIHA